MPRARVLFAESPGVAADQPPFVQADEVITDARNLRSRDSALEKVGGYAAALGSLSATAIYLASVSDGSTDYWVYAGQTVVYATDGATHADIAGVGSLSALDTLGWTGGPFHGFMLLNDSVNHPQQWTPGLANNLSSLSYWPTGVTCDVLRPFQDFLFALRVTDGGVYYPRELRWSDRAAPRAVPGSWDYTDPTNQAGRTELGQTDDPLVDALALRDQFVVYKRNHTWIANYIGGPDYFSFRQLFSQVGLLTENCVAGFQDRHFVVGDSDIIIHDGNSVLSTIDQRMRRWFFNRLDTANYQRSFCVVDDFNREVLVCFVESGATWPTIALVWSWNTDRWHVRELGRAMTFGQTAATPTGNNTIDGLTGTIDSLTGAFDEAVGRQPRRSTYLLDAGAQNAFQLNAAETFAGTTMTCYAERRGLTLSLANTMAVKRVKRVLPLVLGASGDTLDIYIGTRNSVDAPVTYSGPHRYTIGSDHKVDLRASGRFVDLKLEYTGANPMRFIGCDVEFDIDGQR